LFRKLIFKLETTLFLFDAIGLGLFTVVGIDKSLDAHFPFWVAIFMGMISGAVGGVIRDVMINEVPLILRRDIYALACILGGIVFGICMYFSISPYLTNIISVLTVIITRLLAAHFHIQLPTVK
jgi:uncharacterized membrane protein YeiH